MGAPDEVDDPFKAQVMDASGRVLASSSAKLTTPLASLDPAPGELLTSGASPVWLPGDAAVTDLVVAVGITRSGQPLVVLVAAPQTNQHEAVTTVVKILLAAIPLFLILTALSARWLVGRALEPVEEITSRVEGVTAHNLSERVPVPASQDEITTLASTMNSMLGRLQASQATQTRFVSDASHELRSPLTTISGALEIGRSAQDERTWDELAPLMERETIRLQSLVGDLLLLSRSDDKGLRLSLSDVDLDDLVDAEVHRLRSSGTVEVRRDIHAARVTGDHDKLFQALRNLDDNAVRHARGIVLLAVKPLPDGGARIEVSDDGDGVPEADRQRIFERFVRLDESRSRDSGGSGLGLAIVAEVVRSHGGAIRVEDSALGGASFVITLPSRPPAAEQGGAQPPSAASR